MAIGASGSGCGSLPGAERVRREPMNPVAERLGLGELGDVRVLRRRVARAALGAARAGGKGHAVCVGVLREVKGADRADKVTLNVVGVRVVRVGRVDEPTGRVEARTVLGAQVRDKRRAQIRRVEELCNARARVADLVEHSIDERAELGRVVRRQRGVLLVDNAGTVRGVVGQHPRAHLVHDAAKRPHIGLEVVGVPHQDLGRNIARSPRRGVRQLRVVHRPRKPKVAELDIPLRVEKHVLRLEIAVNDERVVDGFERKRKLQKVLADKALRKRAAR
eukprot:Amastigsp_a342112_80.p2 type:complete len:277 gc:universal Amastigsp_a342112_80:479-1309(+)